MSICIGVVAVGPPTWSFVGSIIKLQKPGPWMWRRVGPLAVDVARNRLCREFLAGTDEWLLMVDADADLHPATLVRLLSWQLPIVGALAFSRYGPMFPTVYRGRPQDATKPGHLILIDEVRSWLQAHPEMISSAPQVISDQSPDDLVEVDRTGAHCLLIHRDVLSTVKAPWFLARDDGQGGEVGAGEDFYFCEQAQAAGHRIYVDLGCMAGHTYGERTLAAQDFLVWDYASTYDTPQDGEED